MSTLLSQIQMILAEEKYIKGLSVREELTAVKFQGEESQVVSLSIPRDLLIKIARLQTLLIREREKGEIPRFESVQQQMEATGQDYLEVASNELISQEESLHNVMMIERLIVLVVREVFPREIDHFECRYFVGFKKRQTVLFREPMPKRMFL